MDNKIIIYQTEDNRVKIEVNIKDETVWLSAENIAELFQRDRTVIQRHIRNTYNEGELSKNSTCANFAQVQNTTGTRFESGRNFFK